MTLSEFMMKLFCCVSQHNEPNENERKVKPAVKNDKSKSNRTNESHKIGHGAPHNRNYYPWKGNSDRNILFMNGQDLWVKRKLMQINREEHDGKDKRRREGHRDVDSRPARLPAVRYSTGEKYQQLKPHQNKDQRIHNQYSPQMPIQSNGNRRPPDTTKKSPATEPRHYSPNKKAPDNQRERTNQSQNVRRKQISTDTSDKLHLLPEDKKKQDHICYNQSLHAVSSIDFRQSPLKGPFPLNQSQPSFELEKKLKRKFESDDQRKTSTVSLRPIIQRKRTQNMDATLIDSPSHSSGDEFDGDTPNSRDTSAKRPIGQSIHQLDHIMTPYVSSMISHNKSFNKIRDYQSKEESTITKRATVLDHKQKESRKLKTDARINISNDQVDIRDNQYPKEETKRSRKTHLLNQSGGTIDSQSIDKRLIDPPEITPNNILGQVEEEIKSPIIDTIDPYRYEPTRNTVSLKPKSISETSETLAGKCSLNIYQPVNYFMNECVPPKSESIIEITVARNWKQPVDEIFDNQNNNNRMNDGQNLSNMKNNVRESDKTIQINNSYVPKLELTSNQYTDHSTQMSKLERKDERINDSENKRNILSNITDTTKSTVRKNNLSFGDSGNHTREFSSKLDKSKANQYLNNTKYLTKKSETELERQRRNGIDDKEHISEYNKEKKAIENENDVSYNVENEFKNNEMKYKQSLDKDNSIEEKNKIQRTEININQGISKDNRENRKDFFDVLRTDERNSNKLSTDYSLNNIKSADTNIKEFVPQNKPEDISKIPVKSSEDRNRSKVKDKEEITKTYCNQNLSEYESEKIDNVFIQSSYNINSPKIVDSPILTEEMNQENILQDKYSSEDKNKTGTKYKNSFHSGTFSEEFGREEVGVDKSNESEDSPIEEIPYQNDEILEKVSTQVIEGYEDTSSDETVTSVGEKAPFQNPQGYCFLNSVIQVLRSCKKFNAAILRYPSTQIAESSEDIHKKDFVKNFCEMMINLKKRIYISKQLNVIQKYFESSREGDDVHKCFMNILTVIHEVSKKRKTNERSESTSKVVIPNSFYERFKNEYEGFVFDFFYGEMSHSICCDNCGMEFSKKYQLFKCLPVPLPNSSTSIELISCINSVFESSEIEGESMAPCKCKIGKERIISKSQITYSPEYLFVYLNRGSYFVGGTKKNTFVTCDEELSLQTYFGKVNYKLISTIDHLGSNEGGHYFCRCSYESDEWWLLNDTQVTHLEDTSMKHIISRNTIVFLFKKMKRRIPNKDLPLKSSKIICSKKEENQENASSDETDISVGEKSGFKNPQGYCFLNSVIQVLRSCKKFNTAILKYHKSSKVVDSEDDEKKIIFVIKFCKMMIDLKEKRVISDQLDEIQKYFESSRDGDDVHKCFMNILTVIHDISKEPKDKSTQTNSNPKSIYETFKKDYNGFVFDCFYGEMSHSICCDNCGMEFSKKYQLFKCLPVPLPNSSTSIELIRCINSVFESSEIEGESMMPCKCKNGKERIISKSQITYSPEYLFVYLNRGSYFVGGTKNNTFVTCDKELSLQTYFGKVNYKLISTIDHLGDSEGGHYFCRCSYESDEWWLLNDTQVTYLGGPSIEHIISKNTIVFLFRKIKH